MGYEFHKITNFRHGCCNVDWRIIIIIIIKNFQPGKKNDVNLKTEPCWDRMAGLPAQIQKCGGWSVCLRGVGSFDPVSGCGGQYHHDRRPI